MKQIEMNRDQLISALKTRKTVFEGQVKTDRITPDLDYKPLFEQIVNQISFIVIHNERFNDIELSDYLHSICFPALTIKDFKRPLEEREQTLTEISSKVQAKETFLEEVYGMDPKDLFSVYTPQVEQTEEKTIEPEVSNADDIGHITFTSSNVELAKGTVKAPTPLDENEVLSNDFDYPVFDVKVELDNLIDALRYCSIKYTTRGFRFNEEVTDLYNEVTNWATKSSSEAQRNSENPEMNDYYAKMLHNSAYAANQMAKVLESTNENMLNVRIKTLKDTLSQLDEHYGEKEKTM